MLTSLICHIFGVYWYSRVMSVGLDTPPVYFIQNRHFPGLLVDVILFVTSKRKLKLRRSILVLLFSFQVGHLLRVTDIHEKHVTLGLILKIPGLCWLLHVWIGCLLCSPGNLASAPKVEAWFF